MTAVHYPVPDIWRTDWQKAKRVPAVRCSCCGQSFRPMRTTQQECSACWSKMKQVERGKA